jgi:hypothetical protein
MAIRISTRIRLFVITPYRCVLWTLQTLIESSQRAMQAVESVGTAGARRDFEERGGRTR